MMLLKQAIDYLSARCDGAFTLDGHGFNKIDSAFGKKLAQRSDSEWSPRQKRAAWRMIAKYRKQLKAGGIEYKSIEEPPRVETEAAEKSLKEIESDGKVFIIAFDYDPNLVGAVKGLPQRKFDPAKKQWSVPMRYDTIEPVLIFAAEHGFECLPGVGEYAEQIAAQYEQNLSASRAESAELNVEGLGGELRPFQKAGVEYALRTQRCFIADEMGLGKTVEALATINSASAFPSLIICPASLKLNWEREARKWLPAKKNSIQVLDGNFVPTSEPLRGQFYGVDILILNYDILKKHAENLKAINFKSIIFDEAHFCKNYKALRTKLVKELSKKIPIRLALTGTPLLNRPQELLSQLGILGRLEDLGGFWHFAHHFCGAFHTKWGLDLSGAAHLDELNEKMRATCLIRRRKIDVLKELPPKQRAQVPMELSNRKEYERAESDLIGWLKDQARNNREFLASIADLPDEDKAKAKEARADTAAFKAQQAEQLVRIEALKQVAARGKLVAAKEWIESFLETGEKLIIFAWHREIVETLADVFKCDSITGDTPLGKRQAYVDKFQSDPETKLLAMNVQAGGVGFTLTAASNVAFLELGWNPATMEQATDRCHRIGQEDQVTAWYLLAEKTIDIDINDLIESKRAVVDAATEGDAQAAQGGSILNELIGRLTKRE